MKEEILKLRKEGKTYAEIVAIVGCAKSSVAYHCGKGQKEKSNNRRRVARDRNPLRKKIENFSSRGLKTKVIDFQRNRTPTGYHAVGRTYNFTEKELIKKIGDTPICYLSGREIDLQDSRNYHLDHIVPASKGGSGKLENVGLASKQANKAKDDLSIEDFLLLCKDVLEYNGYKVSKIK